MFRTGVIRAFSQTTVPLMMRIALKEVKALVMLEYEYPSSFPLAFLFVLHNIKSLAYIYSLTFRIV